MSATEVGPPAAPATAHPSHSLEWDPPFGITRSRRWTCTACGNAVIDYCGNVYGSALDPCEKAEARS